MCLSAGLKTVHVTHFWKMSTVPSWWVDRFFFLASLFYSCCSMTPLWWAAKQGAAFSTKENCWIAWQRRTMSYTLGYTWCYGILRFSVVSSRRKTNCGKTHLLCLCEQTVNLMKAPGSLIKWSRIIFLDIVFD